MASSRKSFAPEVATITGSTTIVCAILAQLVRDDGDERGRGDHADLHGIGEDVRENGVQFLTQELGRCLQNVCDAGGILGSQGRDGAHGKYAVGRHGLDVCLDAGASAGSLPAIVNAVFILISPFRIEVL